MESCQPLCTEVAAAVAKDSKGFPERFQTWITLTNETYPNTDPQYPPSLYSVRLITFFLLEVWDCIDTITNKGSEYATQIADLADQELPYFDTFS